MPMRIKSVKEVKMSVEIKAAAPSMPKSLDSLKTTPLIMHRIYFEVQNEKMWYALHVEARNMFGKNYRSQKYVKRRLAQAWFNGITTHRVWFEVSDLNFGTWCSLKHAVIVTKGPDK